MKAIFAATAAAPLMSATAALAGLTTKASTAPIASLSQRPKPGTPGQVRANRHPQLAKSDRRQLP